MSTRRSTRERKQPKAVYEVEDRRKVAEEDEEEEGEEEHEPQDEEDDEEDEDEAFELEERKSTPTKRPRASPQRKPASMTKKATTPRPRKLKPVPEEARPRKQQPLQPQHADGHAEGNGEEGADAMEDGEDDDVFFEAVKRGKASMADLAVEWRERFDEDAEQATREVLNFVLQSCGGIGQCVPPTEKLEKLDMGDLVDYVVDDLEKSNDGYPIASRAKVYKKFHQHFADFWDALIKECYESELMFSTELVEQFIDWLTSLSSAEVRAIRHTTTIAAYAVGNALVDCINTLTQKLSVVQRQLNAESSAAPSKRTTKSPRKSPASKKLEQLQENKKMYDERQAILLELVDLLFKGVVMHRYRDVMPEIRVESVRVLGNWISVVPEHFLKDNYLKYLGWVLNDKDGGVRLGVVDVLFRLYENEEFAGKMELFTSRFLPRFLELCNDVDDTVVEACIKLLIAIDKRSLISSDVELHSVERLVFDESNDVIRKAAAEFVCLQYDAFGVAESNRGAKLAKEQLNTQAIALVEFAEEYIANHNVPADAVATMVDAFWGLDDCQVLQDWKLLTSLLLADKNAPDLTSEQQTLLIRLLVASVGKITGEETEKSGSAHKKKLAKEKEELCVTFCKELPNMLVRFQADVEKLSLLVELIPFLSLSGEVTGLQPTHVKSLLEKLRHAYTANSEVGFLKSLALSIHHLRQSENEVIKRESDIIIHELLQEVLDKLDEALEEDEKLSAEVAGSKEKSRTKKRNSKKDTTDSEYAVRTALTRLHCLITHICVRDFLPQSQVGGTSVASGRRKRERDSASDSVLAQSRMDELASTLVDFICRRTRMITELNPALLQADSIKSALSILYADVLWLTRPLFAKLSQTQKSGEGSVSGAADGEIATEIERVCASRSLLETAVTAVLEMHMNKIEKPRGDDDDENEESQIEMKEIALDDPKVALLVKEAQRAAFLIFCDTRCLFVERFKDLPAPFDTLDWALSKVLVLLTQMYFENEMDSTPEDQPEGEENAEGDEESDQAQAIAKAASDRGKAEILVALGRVSQSNPSNKRQAAAVLRFLVDGGQDSQEVVRAFSKHIKAEAPVRYLEVQMTALRQLYMTILGLREELDGVEDDEANREELEETIAISEGEVKELAKKLSQSLGVGKTSASLRAPFFRFLCEGVRYALERPTQFSFLDILRVYLSRLDKSSTKQLNAYFTQLLEDLDEDVPAEGDDISPEWRIVFDFRSMISDPDGVVKSTAAKALKRKRKLSIASSRDHEAGDDTGSQVDVDEEDVDMEGETESTPSKKPRNTSQLPDTPVNVGNTASAPGYSDGDSKARETVTASTRTGDSSAKRKLDDVEDQTSPSKKARAVRIQSRRVSSGRITQLSDDEDEQDEHEEIADEESKFDEAARHEDGDGDEDEDVGDEFASRHSRRRGRGRK